MSSSLVYKETDTGIKYLSIEVNDEEDVHKLLSDVKPKWKKENLVVEVKGNWL